MYFLVIHYISMLYRNFYELTRSSKVFFSEMLCCCFDMKTLSFKYKKMCGNQTVEIVYISHNFVLSRCILK